MPKKAKPGDKIQIPAEISRISEDNERITIRIRGHDTPITVDRFTAEELWGLAI